MAAGEVVETCYCLPLRPSEIPGSALPRLLFDRGLGGDAPLLFPFGWGLLYNDASEGGPGANLAWQYEESVDAGGVARPYLRLATSRAVEAGAELCVARRSARGGTRDALGGALAALLDCPDPARSGGPPPATGAPASPPAPECLAPPEGIEVRSSALHGNGVFATRHFGEGEVIEMVPNLYMPGRQELGRCFEDYQYASGVPRVSRIALGFGSIYNHSDSPNVLHCAATVADGPLAQRFATRYYAARDIRAGEELLISYGADWWPWRTEWWRIALRGLAEVTLSLLDGPSTTRVARPRSDDSLASPAPRGTASAGKA
ncbi:unnamed protein product [Prorocentrum cordatum]|uniref:SET domain-containing protein n=1 Tax=Prorocentrum cordatum TaxID=2364126 RepID=A0ABN9QAN7_9DINO|nr:unnamed protein product [Polarella glacialis]